jgi:hypothetical protein
MKRIKDIHNVVERCLVDSPAARNSDSLLYYLVCTTMNPDVDTYKFKDCLLRQNELGLPKFESVRRARQKIQQYNELLRSSKEVEDAKYESWKAVREYVES